jgi:hypothetical protein
MKAEGPQIVDAENVVRMGVGLEHGIDPGDVFANRLLAKVGGGVNQNDLAAKLEQDGWPRAAIVGIR